MASFTSSKLLSLIYPPRPSSAHKYDYGHLLIIAGSRLYTGAPTLACLAALRAGVDVVTLTAPRRAADIAAGYSPSLITYPLDGDFLMKKHVEEILRLADKKNALVIGPGLGREKETLEVVRAIVEAVDIPTVVDADAIHAFSRIKNQELKIKNRIIFTPHLREFEALSHQKVIKDDIESKIQITKDAARKLGAIILLKGPIDIITDGTKTTLNKTGSPYMTSGGTGDVLAGIAGAIAAQLHAQSRYDPLLTAAAAAYISGRAGERAARKFKNALIATDVIEEIPNVLTDNSLNSTEKATVACIN